MNNSGLNKTKIKRVAVHTTAGRSVSRSPSPFSGGNKGFSFGKPKPSGRSQSRSPDRSNLQKKVSKVKKDLYDHIERGRTSQSPGRGYSPGVKRTQSQGPAASGDESGEKSQKPYPRKKEVIGRQAQSPGRKSPGDDRGRRSQDKGFHNNIQEASEAEEGDGENQEKKSPPKKKITLGSRIHKPDEQTSGSEVQQKQEDPDKGSGNPIPEVSEAAEEDGDDQEKNSPPKAKVTRGRRIVKPGERTSGSEVQQKQDDSKPDDQEGGLDSEGTKSKEKKPARKRLRTREKVFIEATGVKPDASGDVVMKDAGDASDVEFGNKPIEEDDMDTLLGVPRASTKAVQPASKTTQTMIGDRKEGESTEVVEREGGAGDTNKKEVEEDDDHQDGAPGSEGVGSHNSSGSKKSKKVKPQRLSEEPDASEAEKDGASEAKEEEDLSLESAAERRKRVQKGETVPTNDIEPELRTADAAIAAAIALQRRNGVMVASENVRKAIAAAATEEQRSKWPDIALGTFQVLLLVGKAAMVKLLNGDMTSIDDAMGGGLEILADGMRDLATDAAKNRVRDAQRKRSLVEQGYKEMGNLTGKPKKEEEEKVEVERKPPTQAELDKAKRIRDRVRAHPVGKPPPTDDEVAEAKQIRDAKRARTMTDADYDSLAGLIGKHSATGKKPTGEELRKYNQPEEEKQKELEKFKTIVALQIKEELDKEENDGKK